MRFSLRYGTEVLQVLGWGMTFSKFNEALASLGWRILTVLIHKPLLSRIFEGLEEVYGPDDSLKGCLNRL